MSNRRTKDHGIVTTVCPSLIVLSICLSIQQMSQVTLRINLQLYCLYDVQSGGFLVLILVLIGNEHRHSSPQRSLCGPEACVCGRNYSREKDAERACRLPFSPTPVPCNLLLFIRCPDLDLDAVKQLRAASSAETDKGARFGPHT